MLCFAHNSPNTYAPTTSINYEVLVSDLLIKVTFIRYWFENEKCSYLTCMIKGDILHFLSSQWMCFCMLHLLLHFAWLVSDAMVVVAWCFNKNIQTDCDFMLTFRFLKRGGLWLANGYVQTYIHAIIASMNTRVNKQRAQYKISVSYHCLLEVKFTFFYYHIIIILPMRKAIYFLRPKMFYKQCLWY